MIFVVKIVLVWLVCLFCFVERLFVFRENENVDFVENFIADFLGVVLFCIIVFDN